MTALSAELSVRHRYTEDVIAYFAAKPGVWIEARDLAKIGGFCSWRTRISEARKQFKKDGGDIEWNGQVRASAYRYVPFTKLGPDAGSIRSMTLFDLSPRA